MVNVPLEGLPHNSSMESILFEEIRSDPPVEVFGTSLLKWTSFLEASMPLEELPPWFLHGEHLPSEELKVTSNGGV